MKLFLSRRECEMIVDAIDHRIPTALPEDADDYRVLLGRLQEVMELQCPDDKSTYNIRFKKEISK